MNNTQDYFNKEFKDFDSSYSDSRNIKDVVRRLSYFYNRRAIEGRLNALLSLVCENIEGKKVLEAGCGPGIYSIKLAQKGAIVTALDYSEGMIRVAEENAKKCNVNVDFRLGDFLDYDLKPVYDVVYATGVIEYIKRDEQESFLRKASVISNDVVIVSFPKKYVLHALIRQIWLTVFKGFSVTFFDNSRIAELAGKAGLKEIDRVDVGILWVIKFKKMSEKSV